MIQIEHHALKLSLEPAHGNLAACDMLTVSGDGPLQVHLNRRLDLTDARQGDRELTVVPGDQDKLVRCYSLPDWSPDSGPVTLCWHGTLNVYESYRVCAILPDSVELSGFAAWFPTINRQARLEPGFTYELTVDLPDDWEIVSPGITRDYDTKRRAFRSSEPTNDIPLCAAPSWDCSVVETKACDFRAYSRGLPDADLARFLADCSRSANAMERRFGPLPAGWGGACVLSPRGPEAALWGYQRGDVWLFAKAWFSKLLAADWALPEAPGPMAASLHETIHFWIGRTLGFSNPWLEEATTQYLEACLTSEVIDHPTDCAAIHFEAYRKAIATELSKRDVAVADMTYEGSNYVYWYYKGSWTFWDLEAAVGRAALINALAGVYSDNVGTVIDEERFVAGLSAKLGRDLVPHFRHWFHETGFAPLNRS